jgi:hypothetical protein
VSELARKEARVGMRLSRNTLCMFRMPHLQLGKFTDPDTATLIPKRDKKRKCARGSTQMSRNHIILKRRIILMQQLTKRTARTTTNR